MGTKRAVARMPSLLFLRQTQTNDCQWLAPINIWFGRDNYVDDIFSLWDISAKEVYKFVDFANTFHPTNVKFTCEISSKCTVFLDTEVLKGPHLSTHKILDLQTHFKPTETFQYTHFSSCDRSNCKKGKGEALRLLRTNSVRENFEQSK